MLKINNPIIYKKSFLFLSEFLEKYKTHEF